MIRRVGAFGWAFVVACGGAASSQTGTTVPPPASGSALAPASAAAAPPAPASALAPGPSASAVAPPPRAPVAQLAARGDVTCALLADGSVRCWGNNYFNVISNQHAALGRSAILKPHPIAELPPAAELVLGEAWGCARLRDGTVRCWGTDDGDLGLGTPLPPGPPPHTERPMPVVGLAGVTALSGHGHLCARVTDGTVSCWADYDRGNGDPRDAGSRAPVVVPGFAGALELADGGNLSCARLATQVKCWSDVSPGLIPKGKVRPDPWAVGVAGAVHVFGGDSGACAVTASGAVSCWGTVPFGGGSSGALGVARPIAGLKDVVALALSGDIGCAVTKTGDVLCEQSGQKTPGVVKVPGIANAVEVVVGASHACARTADASVSCWGRNDQGQLGDGSTMDRTAATPVAW